MTSTTRTHRWLAGSGLTLVALLGLGCTDASAHPPMDDIDPAWTCQTGADGAVRTRGTVTNHSSKPSFYIVTVDFTVDGRAFDSATVSVDGVDPGETVHLESAVFDAPKGDADCFVSHVDRLRA